jgi:hypothetical protein
MPDQQTTPLYSPPILQFSEPESESAEMALRSVLQTFYPELMRIKYKDHYVFARLCHFKQYRFAYARGVGTRYSYRWFIVSQQHYNELFDMGYPVVSFLNPNTLEK